jgi:TolA-binding protein
MPMADVVAKAEQAINARQYAQALPLLQEMVRSVEPLAAKNPTYARWTEYALFYIGVCQLEAGQFDPAVTQLESYRQRYPLGVFLGPSWMLTLDALAGKKDWPAVAALAPEIVRKNVLSGPLLSAVHKLWAEALYRDKKWKEALQPLYYVFLNDPRSAARSDAAAMAATCMIRLEDLAQLFRFLPAVFRTAARYDIGFNIALLEGGDTLAAKDRYDKALALYRLVYTKAELLAQAQARLAVVRRRKEAVDNGSDTSATPRQMKRAVEGVEAQIKEIQAYPDYDRQLVLRIASSYYELRRYQEAYLLYRDLHRRFPGSEAGDQALYSAFSTSVAAKEIARAFQDGEDYIRAYPKGLYFDVLTAQLAEIRLNRQEYDLAVEIGERVLKLKPAHSLRDQLLYIIGFSHFQQERLPRALPPLAEVRDKFATGRFAEAAAYWHALTLLFMADYAAARDDFTRFLQKYDTGLYSEDALYRRAVAEYGLSEMDTAKATFAQFVEKYPGSHLKSEALSMIADIEAGAGQLDEALAKYSAAMGCAENQVQINYATFQTARTLELEAKWDEIIDLFQNYRIKHGSKGNFTEAAYWIGMAKMRKGDSQGALDTFFDTLLQHGDGLPHYGVDMIIRDLASEKTQRLDLDQRRAFMDRLYAQRAKVGQEGKRTLELRLITLFAETAEQESTRRTLAAGILRDANIPLASPATLVLMGEEAERLGRADFARRVYEHFLRVYADSDFAARALRWSVEQKLAAGHADEAEVVLRDLANRFATGSDGGWAQKRLADLRRARKDYAGAIEAYNAILAVKAWRGELWAEALYDIGTCHQAQNDYNQAFPFFQRVYVMYQAFDVWAARAYLQSAICLEKAHKPAEALRTLDEMLARKERAELPEGAEARKMRERLGKVK